MSNHDVDVIERVTLDEEHQANFKKPWLMQFANGIVAEFDTEEEACAAQRAHRYFNYLDEMTGEPL